MRSRALQRSLALKMWQCACGSRGTKLVASGKHAPHVVCTSRCTGHLCQWTTEPLAALRMAALTLWPIDDGIRRPSLAAQRRPKGHGDLGCTLPRFMRCEVWANKTRSVEEKLVDLRITVCTLVRSWPIKGAQTNPMPRGTTHHQLDGRLTATSR